MSEFCRPCAYEPPSVLGEAWIAKAEPGKTLFIFCEGCGREVEVDDQGNLLLPRIYFAQD